MWRKHVFYSYLLLIISRPRNLILELREENHLLQDNRQIKRWNIDIVLNNPAETFGLVHLLFMSSWLSFFYEQLVKREVIIVLFVHGRSSPPHTRILNCKEREKTHRKQVKDQF